MAASRPCPVCETPFTPASSRVQTCGYSCGYELRRRKYRGQVTDPVIPPAPPPTIPVAAVSPHAWVPRAVPAPTGNTGRYQRLVCLPDIHAPWQDDRAVALALAVTSYYRPDVLVTLGDSVDMLGFSRFPHDTVAPQARLQAELETWNAIGTAIVTASPGATRYYLRGNHEARLERWLWGHPQLTGFGGFNLGGILKLAELGFDPEVHEELSFCQGSLILRHGTRRGGQFAGLGARQEMALAGTSGISGHTHRACRYVQRDRAGLRVWIESGHLSANPPHYAAGVLNWAQAVVVGEISADGNDFDVDLIPFRLSYKCRIQGRELSA